MPVSYLLIVEPQFDDILHLVASNGVNLNHDDKNDYLIHTDGVGKHRDAYSFQDNLHCLGYHLLTRDGLFVDQLTAQRDEEESGVTVYEALKERKKEK